MNIETQEIEVVKVQAEKALSAVEKIVVNSPETMLEAGDILKRVKTVGKMIKERKEAITKPINEGLKGIRSLFSPIEDNYERAKDTIESKMLSFQRQQESEAEKIRLENASKLEDTTISNDPHRYDGLQAPPEVIKKSEDFHTRTNKVFKVIDKSLLPIEFLEPDMVAIRKAMFAGLQLPGVEYSEEKTIV